MTEATEGGHHGGGEDADAQEAVSDEGGADDAASAEPAEADNKTWGFVGAGPGALGLVVGGLALAQGRRRA